ncbi:MAG: hypothetical protein LBD93_06230 [Treponema sp.]|jgi:hypothetical protein|nr:hypothetical protein [Treponema sp.]
MADWIPTREQDWAATLQNAAKQTAYDWEAAECQAAAGHENYKPNHCRSASAS